MKKYHLNYIYISLTLLIDLISLIIALKLAIFIRVDILGDSLPSFKLESIDKYYWLIIVPILIFIYENIYLMRYDFWTDLQKIFKAIFISFIIVMTLLSVIKISYEYSRVFIIIFFIISAFIVPIFKRLFKDFLFKFDIFRVGVKIVSKDIIQYNKLYNEINKNRYIGFKNSDKNYEVVIIYSKHMKLDKLTNLISKYSNKTKDIYIVPYMDFIDFSYANIVNYSNIRVSAIHIENKLLNKKNIVFKSFFEKILILLVSPLIVILNIFISIIIKLDSKGSILYKQKRLAKDGKIFYIYKYRTMYENSEKVLDKYLKSNPLELKYYKKFHKYQNDPRITKIGKILRKTSLDEIPQFFNILRGEMSLIGPRPYMIEEIDDIGEDNKDIILKVKPGITGFWQVSGRNDLSFNNRVQLDIWYIKNWSLWIDFVIFIKTIKELTSIKRIKGIK